MIINWIKEFGQEFYFLVSEMAPFLLLGFLFAGLLKAFFPVDKITKYLGRRKFGSVVNAALLGVPMPLCSCGVIPAGVSFYQNGATKGATTSFLISTPQTGVDSILATYGLLGLPFAIIRPLVAFLTGILGGGLSHKIDKNQFSSATMNLKNSTGGSEEKYLSKKLKLVFSYGFGELVEDIVKWLLIGLLAAAFLSVVIPDSFFTSYIGNPWLEMTMILVASIPLYVCATGSIPIAAVFLLKGLSPGAALVFLMAGPATNVATMTVIGNTMGRKALIIYLFSIIAGALTFGVIVNEFLPASWFTDFSIMDHEHGFLPDWLKLVSTILLSGMVLVAIYTKWLSPKFFKSGNSKTKNSDMSDTLYTKITVEGMTCNHCKSTVEKNIEGLDGIESAEVNLNDGSVQIVGNPDLIKVENLVNSLGYKYKG